MFKFMHSALCVMISLDILVFCPMAVESAPFLESILGAVVGKASQLFDSDKVTFMGHKCQYTQEPTFTNWELVYRSRFWCTGLAPFAGAASDVSRDGALTDAQKDYARQLVEAKLFSRDELAAFLKK